MTWGCDYESGFYFGDTDKPEAVYYHSHREPYGGNLVRCRWFLWGGGGSAPIELKAEFSGGPVYLRAVPQRYYFVPAKIVD